MRILWSGLVLIATLACAHAVPDRAFVFDGELYAKAYENGPNPAERFAEFTRAGETVESWRKLFVVHWFPADTGSAAEAAARLAKLAQTRDRSAHVLVSENGASAEALVHFTASSPSSDVVEVDAFKYAPAADRKGLVAVQFSFRFTPGKSPPALVKAARQHMVDEIRNFDLGQVRAYFQPSL